jgi:hypothetical protein
MLRVLHWTTATSFGVISNAISTLTMLPFFLRLL